MSEGLARVVLEPQWKEALRSEFESSYMNKLRERLVKARQEGKTLYPPMKKIFRAFDLCAFHNVKVVIIGQDPYINADEAHGLCFSVEAGIRLPPSLRNILHEVEAEMTDDSVPGGRNGFRFQPNRGCLDGWAEQGVLLLNSVLTVEARKSGSHQGFGWERFTDRVVEVLNNEKLNLVFMLWGSYARRKASEVDKQRHLVLEAAHPSPLSASSGFFGCGHFAAANEYLSNHGLQPIDWFAVR